MAGMVWGSPLSWELLSLEEQTCLFIFGLRFPASRRRCHHHCRSREHHGGGGGKRGDGVHGSRRSHPLRLLDTTG